MTAGTFIHQLRLGPWDNFVYFVGDQATRKVAVVDPAWHAPSILREAERLDVEIAAILCTHAHWDHVNKVEALLAVRDVPVHMLAPEVEFWGYRCENLVASRPGDRVRIGQDLEITMVHTPGHTPGSCSYQLQHGEVPGPALVTGDTLFVNGCGRCDFVGGDPEVMFATLHKLLHGLPGHAALWPGHDYGPSPSSTVDEQLANNPWMKHATVADFVAHRMAGKTPNTAPLRGDDAWQPPA